jgi:hypothetical protein
MLVLKSGMTMDGKDAVKCSNPSYIVRRYRIAQRISQPGRKNPGLSRRGGVGEPLLRLEDSRRGARAEHRVEWVIRVRDRRLGVSVRSVADHPLLNLIIK